MCFDLVFVLRAWETETPVSVSGLLGNPVPNANSDFSIPPQKNVFFSPAAGCFPLRFQYTNCIPALSNAKTIFSIPVPSNAKLIFYLQYTGRLQREIYILVSVYRYSNAKLIFYFQYTGTLQREIYILVSVYRYLPTQNLHFSFSIPTKIFSYRY